MDRHDDAQKSVDCFQLFANQAERNVVKAGAAVLFRNADAQQIQLAHFLQNFGMKLLRFVPLFDEGCDFFLRKLADGLHQGFVVFSQLKFNHWDLSLEFRVDNDRTS